jgi:plastocyanin
VQPARDRLRFSSVGIERAGVTLAVIGLMVGATPAAAATRTHTFRVGPVSVGGYATEKGFDIAPTPRRSGYVTAMHARLVDSQGRPVPQERIMLHHAFFLNYGRFRGDRRGDVCRAGVEHFYTTAEEDQALVLPPGYGYQVRKRDRWRVGWMYMNHQPMRDRVYLQYTVTVRTDPQIPVTPRFISVSCAAGMIYSVPGDGGVHERSRTWVVPRGGRIVAGSAHAHGGALSVDVVDERCGARRLLSSDARYGMPEDPIYNLSPVLHEPAPRSMSRVTSASGWAVSRGDRLTIISRYANDSPHSAVMAMMHLYVARGAGRPTPCPPLPDDIRTLRLPFLGAPGREAPPLEQPELSELGPDGVARPVADLTGPIAVRGGDADVRVRNGAFNTRRLSVPSGATVRWRFSDPVRHNVMLASGPRGFASYSMRRGTYRRRLTVPGQYRILCSLHPVTMSQTIEVRP